MAKKAEMESARAEGGMKEEDSAAKGVVRVDGGLHNEKCGRGRRSVIADPVKSSTSADGHQEFAFDQAFPPSCTQVEVYESCSPGKATEGNNRYPAESSILRLVPQHQMAPGSAWGGISEVLRKNRLLEGENARLRNSMSRKEQELDLAKADWVELECKIQQVLRAQK